ncbi:MAG TPA: hypothetical protein GXX25_15855 [Desulfotomaculum sp.]|nr:hypothetical protein [Desulfotomaculum sp.]
MNVISVRLGDASLAKVDTLVQARVFATHFEAAHFLITKGILAQASLIERVVKRLGDIQAIQSELKQLFQDSDEPWAGDGQG